MRETVTPAVVIAQAFARTLAWRRSKRHYGVVVTMADVARIAGVSVSTVSHVINETRFVREETRGLVLAAIEQTGYTHNTIARALVRASTTSIGLIISGGSNPYFGALVHTIGREAGRAGYTLLLGDSNDDPVQELAIARALCERRVDGMVMAAAADPDQRTLSYLAAQALPLVLIDRLPSTDFDQVGVENEEPVAGLVQHLAGHGHRRIGMLSGLAGLSTTSERASGYRLGLEREGLPYDPALVEAGDSAIEPARLAAHRLLGADDRPTALVVTNNLMTIGAFRALRELGLRVPDDVAIVSFDDFDWADLFAPRLTTIAQPVSEIGTEALRLLLRRLADPDQPPTTRRVPPTFMRRESCGCVPAVPDLEHGTSGTLERNA
jgi:LacI family transcriptional regulator